MGQGLLPTWDPSDICLALFFPSEVESLEPLRVDREEASNIARLPESHGDGKRGDLPP